MAKKTPTRKSAAKSGDKLKIGKRTLKDLGAKGENVRGGDWPSVQCTDITRTLVTCISTKK